MSDRHTYNIYLSYTAYTPAFVSTKPLFLVYVKRETDVRKEFFGANRPADTVSSLPSDRRLSLAENTRQKRGTGTNRISGYEPLGGGGETNSPKIHDAIPTCLFSLNIFHQ